MRTLPHHCILTLVHTPMGRASSHAMELVNIWGSSSAVGGRALDRWTGHKWRASSGVREGTHKREAPLEDGRVLCNRRVWCWGRWEGGRCGGRSGVRGSA